MRITQDNIKQFQNDGYFVLERIIEEKNLNELRVESQNALAIQTESMERAGAEKLGLTHKNKRYFLPCRHEESASLEHFLFGDLMIEIVRTILGRDAYLFLELFVTKWPRAVGWAECNDAQHKQSL